MVTEMMTQSSALCANWSINRLHHTSAFPPYGVLVIRPFESILRRWLGTSKSIKLFQLFRDFLRIHFVWDSLKKNIKYMENNSEDDNVIVYAWINLSVGKKETAQEDQRKCVSLMQMLLLKKLPIILTCQSILKLEWKALASFYLPISLLIS